MFKKGDKVYVWQDRYADLGNVVTVNNDIVVIKSILEDDYFGYLASEVYAIGQGPDLDPNDVKKNYNVLVFDNDYNTLVTRKSMFATEYEISNYCSENSWSGHTYTHEEM